MQHPKGLYLLFVTEMAERFSYYGMRALFVLYLVAAFFTNDEASQIYGSYTGLVYLTPLLGGYIADRYWGNRRSIITGGLIMAVGQFLMFASACLVRQSIFAEDGAIDTSVDNTASMWLMFIGLAALIIGNGFFKPNISTMVGDLYEPQDQRKDSAFTIFYMGINLGAFIAPFVCGTLGEGNWADPGRFRWGFFAAGVAMVLSVVVFWLYKDRYLVTPDGQQVGTATVKTEKRKDVNTEVAKDEKTEELKGEKTEEQEKRKASILKFLNPSLLYVVAALLLFLLFAQGTDNVNDYISAAIYSISIVLPVFIITDKSLTHAERLRIGVIYVIAVFVIFFWSAFEQAGSSLTLIADQQTDRHIGQWEMPTTWFQSINPVVVVTFAPLMAMLWEWLLKRGIRIHSITKQALGLMLLALGYVVIAYGSRGLSPTAKMSMWWLFALYFIHTIGELSLSPIGLSLVTKLSPARMASLLMGVWFMSNAASNILAGRLATLLPAAGKPASSFCGVRIETLTDFFLLFAVMAGVASIMLFCLTPLLKRMMKEEE